MVSQCFRNLVLFSWLSSEGGDGASAGCCLTDEEQRQGGAAGDLLSGGQFEIHRTRALFSQMPRVYV